MQSVLARALTRVAPVNVAAARKASFVAPRAAFLRAHRTPRRSPIAPAATRFFAAAASGDVVVEKGDKVAIHYVGTLDDGEEFDSSRAEGREPIAFTVGGGMMIPGFDKGVLGMKQGETKTLECAPADAYGERDDANKMNVPKAEVVNAVGEEYAVVGSKLMVGQGMQATITEVTDDEVVLDCNHPLAGQTLNFDIEVMSI